MGLTLPHHIPHQAIEAMKSSLVSIFNILGYYFILNGSNSGSILVFDVDVPSDDVYYKDEDPPPFEENHNFDFGLDNKIIRRAFIRKVRS